MHLLQVRETFTATSTISRLYIDNKFECFILEDVDRHLENGGTKVYGNTAIPIGKYNVVITPSQRFKRNLPLIENVPQFSGIRIHPGNTSADTEGCLLPGVSKGNDIVLQSKVAFTALYLKIMTALAGDETVTLRIERK